MKTRFAIFVCGLLNMVFMNDVALSLHQHVVLSDKRLSVDGRPFVVKGVCWNPVVSGQSFPSGLPWFAKAWDQELSGDERAILRQDLQLMKGAGINTVRTYVAIVNREVLELLKEHQMYQIVPAFTFHKTSKDDILYIVNQLKDHPTTLFWELGNEWNYNRLYSEGPHRLSLHTVTERIIEAAELIRQIDSKHPISTSYGELPYFTIDGAHQPDLLSKEDFQRLDQVVDVWGLNVYSQDTFKNSDGVPRAQAMLSLSQKPIYFSEYGADAFNTNIRAVDERAQAHATRKLTEEIVDELAWQKKGGNVLGGTIFELSDEWWKAPGSPNHHDEGGHAPGGGPHPDGVFNEEYWGLTTIDRQAREAYYELAKIYKRLP
ncbi:MAG: hypothetical protein HRU09_05410 [Oligoflexales bacterium]|nr:hypothetical protein [Oligoflexales bacterium]